MMTSAGGATRIVPRQSNCVSPLRGSIRFLPLPRAHALGYLQVLDAPTRRCVTKGKGDINRPEANLAWTSSFWREGRTKATDEHMCTYQVSCPFPLREVTLFYFGHSVVLARSGGQGKSRCKDLPVGSPEV